MKSHDTLCIEQIQDPATLARWVPQLACLISPWLDVLADDTQDTLTHPAVLFDNLLEQLPFVWILYNRQKQVVAGASFSQVLAGRHAYLHGVRDVAYRKHPALRQLVQLLFAEAFTTLRLYKLKAEFEADNLGALGFCRLYGFTKEAHFKDDNCIRGQRKDVVVYSLFYPTYQIRTQRKGGIEHSCLSQDD